MRELALVLPHDVWLVDLTATASPDVERRRRQRRRRRGSLRSAVAGPALELSGCATGQEAVAGFVTALKDIDGVTRVGVASSELGEAGSKRRAASRAAPGRAAANAAPANFIAKFELVVAFDAAPVPASGEGEAAPVDAARRSGRNRLQRNLRKRLEAKAAG